MVYVEENIFKDFQFVLDLGSASYKTKKKLREKITENGGIISYILTKKSNYVIVPNNKGTKVDSYKTRKATKLLIPVLNDKFVDDCVNCRRIIDVEPYKVTTSVQKEAGLLKKKITVPGWGKSKKNSPQNLSSNQIEKLKYKSKDQNCLAFPKQFQVVKFVILKSNEIVNNEVQYFVYELQVSKNSEVKNKVRITEHDFVININDNSAYNLTTSEYFFTNCAPALEVLQYLVTEKKNNLKMKNTLKLPNNNIGSTQLRLMLAEMGSSAGILPPQVVRLLSMIEPSDLLDGLDFNVTPDQIIKGVVLLMKISELLNKNEDTTSISQQFYSVLPFNNQIVISNKKILSMVQDKVQLLKDCQLVKESITQPNNANNLGLLYRNLQCGINFLEAGDEEYKEVEDLLLKDQQGVPDEFKIQNIFCVHKSAEEIDFQHFLQNKKLLFHSSKAENFFGIMTRGLLPPLVVIDDHGGERSDAGMLGNGIYFSDSVSRCCGYSTVNQQTKTRLMLINEVALGRVHEVTKHDTSLTSPPSGHDSVRGVGIKWDSGSEFKENEFVIYNKNQQKMKYLVEFIIEGDSPQIIELPKEIEINENQEDLENKISEVELTDVESVKDPSSGVKSGLVVTSPDGDKVLPLQEVHIRGNIMDMVAQVIVMQAYVNESNSPMEAKYVFPLPPNSVVCGFEAFINNKHVVGVVKEKEQAHREYKEAVQAGHGAYLMDEEKPDVFTVSVGNLPPDCSVLIKITFLLELNVIQEHGTDFIEFKLPGSLSSNIRDQVLVGEVTQVDVERVTATGTNLSKFSLQLSVEMPFQIRKLESSTHKILTKQSATKASIKLGKEDKLSDQGFRLIIHMAEIHVPRMWAEKHPDNPESQASMVSFYPEFDSQSVRDYNAVILLDMSNSMEKDLLHVQVKKLALLILKKLPEESCLNVVKFGSYYQELFVCPQKLTENVKDQAANFIQSCQPTMYTSEIWRPLNHYLTIQQTETSGLTNIYLLSDGHFNNEERLVGITKLLGKKSENMTRIFTCTVGTTANQYLMQTISQTSGGAHEHFNSDQKSKWEDKISNQLRKSEQPVLTDIQINWKTFDTTPVVPPQAPLNIRSVFNCSRLVVYSFTPYCTQVELSGKINGQEISTIVSTSDLNIVKGKTLHRLCTRAIINDHESESLSHEKKATKLWIIDLSTKHSVVSKYTSFVAIEEREKGEDLSSGKGPTIQQIVEQENFDLLEEIGWPEEDKIKTTYERFKDELDQAKLSYPSSISQCERNFSEASFLCDQLKEEDKKKAKILTEATKHHLGLPHSKLLQDDYKSMKNMLSQMLKEIEDKSFNLFANFLYSGFDDSEMMINLNREETTEHLISLLNKRASSYQVSKSCNLTPMFMSSILSCGYEEEIPCWDGDFYDDAAMGEELCSLEAAPEPSLPEFPMYSAKQATQLDLSYSPTHSVRSSSATFAKNRMLRFSDKSTINQSIKALHAPTSKRISICVAADSSSLENRVFSLNRKTSKLININRNKIEFMDEPQVESKSVKIPKKSVWSFQSSPISKKTLVTDRLQMDRGKFISTKSSRKLTHKKNKKEEETELYEEMEVESSPEILKGSPKYTPTSPQLNSVHLSTPKAPVIIGGSPDIIGGSPVIIGGSPASTLDTESQFKVQPVAADALPTMERFKAPKKKKKTSTNITDILSIEKACKEFIDSKIMGFGEEQNEEVLEAVSMSENVLESLPKETNVEVSNTSLLRTEKKKEILYKPVDINFGILERACSSNYYETLDMGFSSLPISETRSASVQPSVVTTSKQSNQPEKLVEIDQAQPKVFKRFPSFQSKSKNVVKSPMRKGDRVLRLLGDVESQDETLDFFMGDSQPLARRPMGAIHTQPKSQLKEQELQEEKKALQQNLPTKSQPQQRVQVVEQAEYSALLPEPRPSKSGQPKLQSVLPEILTAPQQFSSALQQQQLSSAPEQQQLSSAPQQQIFDLASQQQQQQQVFGNAPQQQLGFMRQQPRSASTGFGYSLGVSRRKNAAEEAGGVTSGYSFGSFSKVNQEREQKFRFKPPPLILRRRFSKMLKDDNEKELRETRIASMPFKQEAQHISRMTLERSKKQTEDLVSPTSKERTDVVIRSKQIESPPTPQAQQKTRIYYYLGCKANLSFNDAEKNWDIFLKSSTEKVDGFLNKNVEKQMIENGAKSFGSVVYEAVKEMLLMAILIRFLQLEVKDDKKEQFIETLKEHLLLQDKSYPMIYSRLELGQNWEEAADTFVRRIFFDEYTQDYILQC